MKKFRILLIISILMIFRPNVYSANVENIRILDDKNIELELSSDIDIGIGSIDSDIKFLKDIDVDFATKDLNDPNKLSLSLSSSLEAVKSYSLLTIIGPDVSLDFDTGLSLDDYEILNTRTGNPSEQGLNRIVIKDPKTIELYFNNILEEENFEFKILNELSINSIYGTGNGKIAIELNDNLEKLTNYLIMILSLKDSMSNLVAFEEDLYELKTTQNLKSAVIDVSEEELVVEETPVDVEEIDPDVESVALNSAETPDTGPETTVLVILTFMMTSVVYLRKKLIKR